MTRRDLGHYRGCLLGGAVGDALGAPVEFLPWSAIQARFGPAGIQDPAEAFGRTGAITDDTQLLLFTAEGLLCAHHRRDAGPGSVAETVHGAYLRWLRTQGERAPIAFGGTGWLFGVRELHERREPGETCLGALRSGLVGTPRDPLNDSKGCGGVMRIAPVGLALREPLELACEIAAITHGHTTGYLAAGLFAEVVARLVAGDPLPRAVAGAAALARRTPGGAEAAAAVDGAVALAAGSAGSPEEVERLGGGWTAAEAVAIAVYCALVARDFAHGVRLAVNHSGDSDTTGSLTGSLLGLLHGEEAIPAAWLEVLELREVIGEVAKDLWWHFAAEPPAPCASGGDCGQLRRYPGG